MQGISIQNIVDHRGMDFNTRVKRIERGDLDVLQPGGGGAHEDDFPPE